jgi:hypothetical protein
MDGINPALAEFTALGFVEMTPGYACHEPEYPRRVDPPHSLRGRKLGCIVAIMTDAMTAEPTGAISRTYVAPDLTKIGRAKDARLAERDRAPHRHLRRSRAV